MGNYFLRRLLLAVLTVVGVLYLVFMFQRLALPGIVALQIIGDEGTYGEADLRRLERDLGLRGNALSSTRDFSARLGVRRAAPDRRVADAIETPGVV